MKFVIILQLIACVSLFMATANLRGTAAAAPATVTATGAHSNNRCCLYIRVCVCSLHVGTHVYNSTHALAFEHSCLTSFEFCIKVKAFHYYNVTVMTVYMWGCVCVSEFVCDNWIINLTIIRLGAYPVKSKIHIWFSFNFQLFWIAASIYLSIRATNCKQLT